VEKEDEMEPGDLVLNIKKWGPSTWALSKPIEIIINKNDSVEKAGQKISELSEIPFEKLRMFKI